MKTNNLILTGLFFLYSFYVFSQRNPNQEILIFFSTGVSQEVVAKQGKTIKTAKINDVKLKSALKKMGIEESMLEVAMPNFNRKDTYKMLSDGSKVYQADMSKLYRIHVSNRQKRDEIIKQLNSLPEVLYAEANGSVSPDVIPSDTYFQQQWGLKNDLHPGKDIHAEGAWDIYTGNPNNIIAIIDGGTNKYHSDLNDKIAGGDNGYGWSGHGIHVSGIAAAESNNNQGVSGVDWYARIHAQRIDNVSDDAATYQAIVDAVNYSSNVHVLNNSWGLTDNGNPGRYSTTVKLAYVYAYNANRTMVSAMGNHNDTHPGVPNYPAGYGIGIAVGATDNNDNIAYFSVHGDYIDVSAPGVAIYSTLNNSYGNMSGTSMATPFVTGIASLLKGYKPNLSNDDVENIIRLSADEVTGMNGNSYTTTYGYGRVNAEQALKYLQSPYNLYQWTTKGNVTNVSSQYTQTFINIPGLSDGKYIVKKYEISKNVVYPEHVFNFVNAWGRGSLTNGFNQSNPNLGQYFCEVIPGSANGDGLTIHTYVYEIWNLSGQHIGFYPSKPEDVIMKYSVLGNVYPEIELNSNACNNSQISFNIQNPPPNTNIYWSYSNNLNYVAGQNTSTLTLSTTNNNGIGWVKAVVEGITIEKEFWIGKSSLKKEKIGSCYEPIYKISATYPDRALEFKINHNGNIEYHNGVSYYEITSDNYNLQDGESTTVYVNIRNNCGWSSTYPVVITKPTLCDCGYDNPGCGGSDGPPTELNVDLTNIFIYPNPSSDIVKINIGDSETKLIQVVNNAGKIINEINVDKYIIEFDISNFANGLYFVKFFTKDGVKVHKLIIAH